MFFLHVKIIDRRLLLQISDVDGQAFDVRCFEPFVILANLIVNIFVILQENRT